LLPGVEGIPEHLLFLKELNWVSFANGIDDVEALDKLESGITQQKLKSLPKTSWDSPCSDSTTTWTLTFTLSPAVLTVFHNSPMRILVNDS
jgi:hypothetical protein